MICIPHNRDARNGFSLVEMIAALTIFSVAALALMEVFAGGLHSASTTLHYTEAAFLAKQAAEEGRADGVLGEMSESGERSGTPTYAWTRTTKATEIAGLHQMDVTVKWDERGKQKRFCLTTLVADRQ